MTIFIPNNTAKNKQEKHIEGLHWEEGPGASCTPVGYSVKTSRKCFIKLNVHYYPISNNFFTLEIFYSKEIKRYSHKKSCSLTAYQLYSYEHKHLKNLDAQQEEVNTYAMEHSFEIKKNKVQICATA